MTPLAARLFRQGNGGDQRVLAGCQFFECTALTSMALEMQRDDIEARAFSANARLPASWTFIEAMIRGQRIGFICQEGDLGDRVIVTCIADQGGVISGAWSGAFFPGSEEFLRFGGENLTDKKRDSIFVGLMLVEKYLCIINQPGLVGQRDHNTDKRVLRLASSTGLEAPPLRWHECHIRPGLHGTEAVGAKSEHRERQLHYVRKHLKPSLGPDRWIDGYWRGNADLGLHLKHYVAHPGRDAVVTADDKAEHPLTD